MCVCVCECKRTIINSLVQKHQFGRKGAKRKKKKWVASWKTWLWSFILLKGCCRFLLLCTLIKRKHVKRVNTRTPLVLLSGCASYRKVWHSFFLLLLLHKRSHWVNKWIFFFFPNSALNKTATTRIDVSGGMNDGMDEEWIVDGGMNGLDCGRERWWRTRLRNGKKWLIEEWFEVIGLEGWMREWRIWHQMGAGGW